MSNTKIPTKTAIQLWVRSGGRCQYRGCANILFKDDLTQTVMINGYIAHIVADAPDGPRGDPVLSPLLARDVSNLMLMCPTHHKLIDVDDVAGHPVNLLQSMKRDHEDLVTRILGQFPEHKSHVLVFTTPVGDKVCTPSRSQIFQALSGGFYPARDNPEHINLNGDEVDYYDQTQWQYLSSQVRARVRRFVEAESPKHISIFAFAPIPLLIVLGRTLGDVQPNAVFQPDRIGNWIWQDAGVSDPPLNPDFPEVEADVTEVALKIEFSTVVHDDHIFIAVGRKLPVYRIGIDSPAFHSIGTEASLIAFKATLLTMMEQICEQLPQVGRIHLFAAVPPAIAVAIGQTDRSNFPRMVVYQSVGNGIAVATLEV